MDDLLLFSTATVFHHNSAHSNQIHQVKEVRLPLEVNDWVIECDNVNNYFLPFSLHVATFNILIINTLFSKITAFD